MILVEPPREEEPEYLPFRCCMCPNIGENKAICPGIEGTPHPKPSKCRFVKSYIDENGYVYTVLKDWLDLFVPVCIKYPDSSFLLNLPSRDRFDLAQADLNEYAKSKGLKEYEDEKVSKVW